jgi:hypothetical protein
MFKFVILFLLLSFSYAKADVLFIDLDKASGEIVAAKEAAKKIGEKLIIIPTGDEKITDENLLKLFEKIDKPISQIIISGHGGSGVYGGSSGEISYQALKKAFDSEELSEYFQNTFSMHLWGCYSVTPLTIDLYWKNILPALKVIDGFKKRSPADPKPYNSSFLKDMILESEQVQLLDTVKASQRILNAINKRKFLAPAAFYQNSCESTAKYISPSTGVIDLEEARSTDCDSLFEEMHEKVNTEILPIADGIIPFTEDPRTGKIRQALERAREFEDCLREKTAEGDFIGFTDPDRLLMLNFWPKIVKNFKLQHGKELKELFSKSGYGDLNLDDLDKRENIVKLKNLVMGENQTRLRQLLYNGLYYLDPNCIPFDWAINENSSSSLKCN